VIIHGGNVHIVLTFDDGIKWLARIKHSLDVSPPLHVQKQENTKVMDCKPVAQ